MAADATAAFASGADALSDATLHDVYFADSRRGWAVGDRGTLLVTENGGRRWHVQRTGVTCTLWAIDFVTVEQGMILGGGSLPLTHESRGLVLKTLDGGTNWRPVPALDLPALRGGRMLDRERGIVFGQASAKYPSGVARTIDGGLTWYDALPGDAATQGYPFWRGGNIDEDGRGFLVADDRVVELPRSGVPRRVSLPGNARIAELIAGTGQTTWGIATEGRLLFHPGGRNQPWSFAVSPHPEGSQAMFTAFAAAGPQFWLATFGREVTIYRSSDRGRTWVATPTAISVPIQSMHFVDRSAGWAVGGRGVILATVDGGKSWQQQAGVASPAEALVLADAADPDAVLPVAQLRQAGGWPIVLLDPRSLPRADRGDCFLGDAPRSRLRDAYISAGAGSVEWLDTHPAATPAQVLAEKLLAWRPAVILLCQRPRSDALAGHRSLFEMGRQGIAFAEGRSVPGDLHHRSPLDPAWRAERIYVRTTAGGAGIELDPLRLFADSGRTLGELVMRGRGLIQTHQSTRVKPQNYLVIADRTSAGEGDDDFLAGIPARGVLPPAGVVDPQAFRKRSIVRTLATALASDEVPDQRWQGEIRQLAAVMDPTVSIDTLAWLVQHYINAGRLEMAAATNATLMELFPEDEFAPAAALWLMHYRTSGEVHYGLGGTRVEVNESLAQQQPAVAVSDEELPAIDRTREDVRGLAVSIEQRFPGLAVEPLVRLPLASWFRRHGEESLAKDIFVTLHQRRMGDAWGRIAGAERWLMQADGRRCPLPIYECAHAASRPHLDGSLDEPLWSQLPPLLLRTDVDPTSSAPAASPPESADTEVRMGYDERFFYLGIRATRFAASTATVPDEPRTRDEDLSPYDRVELRVDRDRDYVTAFVHEIDHRGHTCESCWGSLPWDPAWYVASGGDSSTWTIEAAIPLETWTARPPQPGDVWAISLRRMLGDRCLACWQGPCERDCASANFGLLRWKE